MIKTRGNFMQGKVKRGSESVVLFVKTILFMFALGSTRVISLSASISLFFCPFKEYFYVPSTFFWKRESPLSARKTTSCNLFLHRLLTIKDVFRKQISSPSRKVFFLSLYCPGCPALSCAGAVCGGRADRNEKLAYFEMTPLLKLSRTCVSLST